MLSLTIIVFTNTLYERGYLRVFRNHFKSMIYLTPTVFLNRHRPTLNWRVRLELMTENLLNNISKFIKLQERKGATVT